MAQTNTAWGNPALYVTTDHPASSYGQPVLVNPRTGTAYGVLDKIGMDYAFEYAERSLEYGLPDPHGLLAKFATAGRKAYDLL